MKDLRDPVLLLLLLLVSLLDARGAQPRQLCANGTCLLLFTHAPLSFEGARAACEAQAGDLAPLGSPKDRDRAAGILGPPVPAGRFWISGGGCVSSSTNGSWWQEEPCGAADGFLCAAPDGRCRVDDGRFAAPGATRAEWPPAAVGAPRTAFGRDASRFFRSAWICGGDGTWMRAPWSCEVMDGGCERGCRNSTCLCPDGHALHANGVQCVTLPAAETPAPPACVVGGRGCADPNRLCVARPDGGAECACRSGYDEQDGGACVDVSVCSRCEHMLCRPQVVGGPHLCACRHGFAVSPADPTRCEQRCEQDECPAICVDGVNSCRCPTGYILSVHGNASVCTYLDMCQTEAPCDHLCENVRGGYGYTCACHPGFLQRGDRCVCQPGFLQRGDRCVATTPEPGPTPVPEPGPGPGPPSPSAAAAGVPAYVRVGSALGMTLFVAGGAALLYLLLRVCVSRAGGTSWWATSGGADLDGLTLQQVTTEKYLRFDKRPSDTVDLRTVRPTLDT